jgi:hypothetical protein
MKESDIFTLIIGAWFVFVGAVGIIYAEPSAQWNKAFLQKLGFADWKPAKPALTKIVSGLVILVGVGILIGTPFGLFD